MRPRGAQAMKATLRPGLRREVTLKVVDDLTVPRVSPRLAAFADMPPVFVTATMVGLVEAACVERIAPHLDPGERSVGTHVDSSRGAATPVGITVRAAVGPTGVEGGALAFRVSVRDDAGPIGTGTHRRAVIDAARFAERAHGRAGAEPAR